MEGTCPIDSLGYSLEFTDRLLQFKLNRIEGRSLVRRKMDCHWTIGQQQEDEWHFQTDL